MKRFRTWLWLFIGLSVSLMVMVVLFFLFFRLTPWMQQFRVQTEVAEFGELEITEQVRAIAAREEKIYPLPEKENLRWLVSEGERVGRNQKIADIIGTEEESALALEHRLLTMRIDLLETDQDPDHYVQEAQEEIETQMEEVIQNLHRDLSNDQYDLVFQHRTLLEELMEQKQLVNAQEQFPNTDLETLQRKKQQVEEKLAHHRHEIRTPDPGWVAFGMDGMEDIMVRYDEEAMEKQLVDDLNRWLEGHVPASRDDVYRIVQQHHWWLFLEMDPEEIHRYDVGDRIRIRESERQTEAVGQVKRTLHHPEAKTAFVVLELNQSFVNWVDRRHYTIEMIQQREEGLIVPHAAVMEHEKEPAVYRVDISGHVELKPVHLLATDGEKAVVGLGPIPGREASGNQGSGTQQSTIKPYDRIITNPERVEEGQKIR